MEINNDILSLILKNLQNRATASEQAELEQWLNSNESNKLEYQKVADIWSASENINVDIDVDQEWNTFRSKHFDSQKRGKLIQVDFRMVSRIAAAAILLIGVFLAGQYILGSKTYTTHSGERLLVNLEDGTKVILGENSELSVSRAFNNTYRDVELQGEGFFEVAKNPNKPFEIKGLEMNTRVLGTAFHLIENAREHQLWVTEGKVAYYRPAKNDTAILTIGHHGQLVNGEILTNSTTVDSTNSWQTGVFRFDSENIVSVLESLQNFYVFSIPDIEKYRHVNCRFSGSFSQQPLKQVLSEIAMVMGMDYTLEDNKLYIKNFRCE